MTEKPTYEELKQRVAALQEEVVKGKQAEKALRESEERFRLLYERAPLGYQSLDERGYFLEVNQAWLDTLGYAREEVIGKSFGDFLHPEWRDHFKENFPRFKAVGEILGVEFEMMKKDGSFIMVAFNGKIGRDKEGCFKQTHCILHDITSQKRSEEALKERTDFLDKIIESSALSTWISDEKGTAIRTNPACLAFFGATGEEVIGKYNLFQDVVIEKQGFMPDIKRVFEKGEVASILIDYDFSAVDHVAVKKATHKIVNSIFTPVLDSRGKVSNVIVQAIDLTDIKNAEAALRESEQKYRLIAENTADLISVLNMNLRFTYVSPASMRLLGYTVEEVMERTLEQFLTPESMRFGLTVFQKEMQLEASGTADPDRTRIVELEGYKKDGATIWIEASLSFLRDKDHKPVGILIVSRDITERKRAEAALRTFQQRLSQIIDFLPDATMVVDLEGKVIAWNRAIEEMTGVKAKDILGKGNYEYAIPFYGVRRPILIDLVGRWNDEAAKTYQYVKKEGESLVSETYDCPAKPGGTLWNRASLLYDNNGKVIGAIESIRDISEHKRAEASLRFQKAYFEGLVDNMPDAIAMFDDDGIVTEINTRFTRMFGFTEEEAVGQNISELVGPPDRLEEAHSYRRRITSGEKMSVETVRKNKDGTLIDVSLRSAPVIVDDTPIGHFVLYRDISSRKQSEIEKSRLQSQLQQAQKMEAIGTLAGGIAHDFNNLLMAIQGRTSIMLMDKDSSHPDFVHLRGIEGYVGNAADLTKQLLGFARGGKYEVKPTDLNELIKKESRMFGRTKKEISIHEKYEENLWPVEVDRGQIQQVLLNLYVNAWQAMPGGGNLYVETENVTLDDHYVKPFSVASGRYVKIHITDTGIGMDKATREKIFDPFFTTKGLGRGTGLGLASAYGIIKNHGGFINVYSEKGHGSTFSIYLPASEKEIIERKEPIGETLTGSETVLFVDDEEIMTEVAGDLLRLLGYKVLIAGNGKEAIRIYEEKKERIDLVILDMIMPDMGGGETYDRMKDINPEVKVLLSSGYSINGQATEILDRGCNGFIQKPFKMVELSQKLREILDER